MYNRDYLSNQSSEYTHESSQVQLMSFLKATYQLFAGSLLAATAGAYIGLGIVSILMGPVKWVLFAVELALIFFVTKGESSRAEDSGNIVVSVVHQDGTVATGLISG